MMRCKQGKSNSHVRFGFENVRRSDDVAHM